MTFWLCKMNNSKHKNKILFQYLKETTLPFSAQLEQILTLDIRRLSQQVPYSIYWT